MFSFGTKSPNHPKQLEDILRPSKIVLFIHQITQHKTNFHRGLQYKVSIVSSHKYPHALFKLKLHGHIFFIALIRFLLFFHVQKDDAEDE